MWVVFNHAIISSEFSFVFLSTWWFQESYNYWMWFTIPLAPEEADTTWATWVLRALNAVRAAQILLCSQGLPPSDPSLGPCILASLRDLCPGLQSLTGTTISCFPNFPFDSALSCPRLHHPCRSCFQTSAVSWGSFFSNLERALSLHSQGLGLRLSVPSSSLPLSLRLYYCVTSSPFWRHYISTLLLS